MSVFAASPVLCVPSSPSVYSAHTGCQRSSIPDSDARSQLTLSSKRLGFSYHDPYPVPPARPNTPAKRLACNPYPTAPTRPNTPVSYVCAVAA
ncbi:uncharacterized protein VTP21DRAFT_3754 [Calcarisporiella thermophila]|uniref:uncharacterized protein n=1 Tax=Calcarisporiella thermophila TaxID=911321 RepID=UPI00374437F1